MLSKKKTPDVSVSKPSETIDTLIGQKTVLSGDLEFSGGLRIDGQINGNISSHDENNGTLVLSELGEIDGDVTVPHVIINGTVNGSIHSSGRVELQSKSKITGDVHYNAVEMELGASINGNLVCEPASSSSSAGFSGLKSLADDKSPESSGSDSSLKSLGK